MSDLLPWLALFAGLYGVCFVIIAFFQGVAGNPPSMQTMTDTAIVSAASAASWLVVIWSIWWLFT